mmetsp:Transcript_31250/g.89602  ORF Transcript_31250/g.89602 Transcript_31250/m.89602 type:complete len:491 (-) Transcript_31250:77-1549(-)|eukprot:CAMPEP_0168379724 /NCGR_PEP_ID=MMETSP0228-20121227/11992_1 /TAXON_ID=133427 /ORGANISM="Protoceratium reticulatum, Strain CCCM 535 (=CCMP 1889)" /LENGTH=490 /DNA_ID=CAMNT_0008392767 /DNA_START=65 /DNA_END=1537 /DNA_ORIENTATION=+
MALRVFLVLALASVLPAASERRDGDMDVEADVRRHDGHLVAGQDRLTKDRLVEIGPTEQGRNNTPCSHLLLGSIRMGSAPAGGSDAEADMHFPWVLNDENDQECFYKSITGYLSLGYQDEKQIWVATKGQDTYWKGSSTQMSCVTEDHSKSFPLNEQTKLCPSVTLDSVVYTRAGVHRRDADGLAMPVYRDGAKRNSLLPKGLGDDGQLQWFLYSDSAGMALTGEHVVPEGHSNGFSLGPVDNNQPEVLYQRVGYYCMVARTHDVAGKRFTKQDLVDIGTTKPGDENTPCSHVLLGPIFMHDPSTFGFQVEADLNLPWVLKCDGGQNCFYKSATGQVVLDYDTQEEKWFARYQQQPVWKGGSMKSLPEDDLKLFPLTEQSELCQNLVLDATVYELAGVRPVEDGHVLPFYHDAEGNVLSQEADQGLQWSVFSTRVWKARTEVHEMLNYEEVDIQIPDQVDESPAEVLHKCIVENCVVTRDSGSQIRRVGF